MGQIKYNKLVRDRIPEIIEASGKNCVAEILSDEDYLCMIDAKLDEELAEYHKDQNIEELADLIEVIYAAAKARGYVYAHTREECEEKLKVLIMEMKTELAELKKQKAEGTLPPEEPEKGKKKSEQKAKKPKKKSK